MDAGRSKITSRTLFKTGLKRTKYPHQGHTGVVLTLHFSVSFLKFPYHLLVFTG